MDLSFQRRGTARKGHEDNLMVTATGVGRTNYLNTQTALSLERQLPYAVITTDVTSGF